ncbi:MAG: serine/threonine protein phosphatase [Rhizobiales bacterium]|nr:serine/threonine protein phosphatase [Hyphomicrobiales bacterium]
MANLLSIFQRRRGNSAAAVQAALPAGTVVHAVGDVHGRSDLLDEVFSRIDRDRADYPDHKAIEIYLGDYVDRGPDSSGVVDRLIARSRDREVELLRGNHDAFFVEMLGDAKRLEHWEQLGGVQTMLSYGIKLRANLTPQGHERMHREWCTAVPQSHRAFFAGLRNSLTIGDYFFVHAGIRPGIALDRQSADDLLWIREEFHRSKSDHGKMVVHAHSPVEAPEFHGNRINIDTKAYASGVLTCLRLVGSAREIIG